MSQRGQIKTLTEEQKVIALQMRNVPSGNHPVTNPRTIAKALGVAEAAVMRALGLMPPSFNHIVGRAEKRMEGIPPKVLYERDMAYQSPDTIETYLLGSPRPGRSALDRKNICNAGG